MRKQFSRGLQTLDKSTVSALPLDYSFSLLFGLFPSATHYTPTLNTHFAFDRPTHCPSFRPCLLIASAWEGIEKPF